MVTILNQRILVTGGAGFIGSHLVERLLYEGAKVTVLDNFNTGKEHNLKMVYNHPNFRFVKGDIRNRSLVDEVVDGQNIVFHFCDDSDIRSAAAHPDSYVEQNIMGLYYVLESMRKHNVKTILFPSSTTVLGEIKKWPASEDHGPLAPLSLYGGAKLAAEGLISAWANTFGLTAIVFRFVGIIGGRMDHGVVHDFVRKLEVNDKELEILGDGTQSRSFVIIDDCIDAMLLCLFKLKDPYQLVHIGNKDQISINTTADAICSALSYSEVKRKYTGGKVGWIGDSTSNFILTETLDKLGWRPAKTSEQAVSEAAKRLSLRKAVS
jgi:UDP-glucose 4-epimerase